MRVLAGELTDTRTPAQRARPARGVDETVTAHPPRGSARRCGARWRAERSVDDREHPHAPNAKSKRLAVRDMALRWTAAEMLEAEQQFRRSSANAELASSPSRSSATHPPPHRTARTRSPLRRARKTITTGPPSKIHERGTSSEKSTANYSCAGSAGRFPTRVLDSVAPVGERTAEVVVIVAAAHALGSRFDVSSRQAVVVLEERPEHQSAVRRSTVRPPGVVGRAPSVAPRGPTGAASSAAAGLDHVGDLVLWVSSAGAAPSPSMQPLLGRVRR